MADAPNGRERVQIFDAGGVRTGGFLLPGRGASRVVLGTLSLNGVGTLTFNGRLMLMSHPETGWLFTEYTLTGVPIRSIGQLRKTGHESDRDLHLALNAGIPVADPKGGFYFVFMAGQPVFRKYDAERRAGLRAGHPGPRDRSRGRGDSRPLARGARQASCRWSRRRCEPRP